MVRDALPDAAEGLRGDAVERARAAHGRNEMPQPRAPHPLRLFAAQLTHLLALLLWVAAGLALLAGMPQLAVAIVTIVLLNGAFAFWQEFRADRSAQQLRSLLPVRARVVRDGRPVSVDVTDLVVGDYVLLEAGDRVGADMEVLSGHGLTLNESMLTGESAAVPRSTGEEIRSGTFVLEGDAAARVTAVGSATALAAIARLTDTATRPPSPLTVQLRSVVRVVAIVAAGTGVALGIGSVLLGLGLTEAFLFGVGVSVALVPEGLLPTVTLSLARGAQLMARRQALVRRLDAVETLGATTFICTDKTGTLTQNRMSVVAVATTAGTVRIAGEGYSPDGTLDGSPQAVERARRGAAAALACVTGRVSRGPDGTWVAEGDPMEAAIHALALRAGVPAPSGAGERLAYTPDRMLSSHLHDGRVSVLGAPEAVIARCVEPPENLVSQLAALTDRGYRVVAAAERTWAGAPDHAMEHELRLVALLALQDPPRPDVAEALDRCRAAAIRVAMITGDHPRTARAIATQVGLLTDDGVVLNGPDLPASDAALAALLDTPGGAVVARAAPADKLRIAVALRGRGHVVAMTGDGVNDAPALRAADVGVAMGASGSDVAREAADLVLLDDHFVTIVAAVQLGRATFANVRRFLTFHLTDNVAELAPFALWALTGGSFPLAFGVLQVLALDIGTDMLPALALGAEPARDSVMQGTRRRRLVDRALLLRAFLVLGLTEAVLSLGAFAVVLVDGGWRWGEAPDPGLLATASGTAFATVACCQIANSFACRSTTRPVWRVALTSNRLLLGAVAAELVLLLVFVGVPPVADLLGGTWPSALGWVLALCAAVVLVLVDAAAKTLRRDAPAALSR
ncbi:cation-translocating P-type ATPase [Nocardioides dongkuii]|uniref:cation-translocating P-type ATPase n=1 Tax=Nocardioides dongkuii TaxID=2760089 RepID=UPI0015F977CB|nr:cation-transporting P-type ATPase [Nocardioides dongkuii]